MEAVIFVHPGYLRRTDAKTVNVPYVHSFRSDPRYGSYDTYLRNLQHLHQQVKGKAIFFVETIEDKLHPYHSGFEPGEGSVILEWSVRRGAGNFYHPLFSNSGKLCRGKGIQKDSVGSYLKDQGIDGCFIAGELGPYEYSPVGCVGTIFNQLKEQFSLKGVQGCIFPIIPDRTRLSKEFRLMYLAGGFPESNLLEHERLMKALYDKAVSLENFAK